MNEAVDVSRRITFGTGGNSIDCWSRFGLRGDESCHGADPGAWKHKVRYYSIENFKVELYSMKELAIELVHFIEDGGELNL